MVWLLLLLIGPSLLTPRGFAIGGNLVQPLGSTNCRTTWAECLLPMASTWVPTLPTQHLKNQLPPGQSLARPRSSLHLDRDQRCRPAPKLALSGSRPSLSLLSPALLHRTRVPGSALASPMSICLASRLRSIILKGAATSGVSRPLVRVNPPLLLLGCQLGPGVEPRRVLHLLRILPRGVTCHGRGFSSVFFYFCFSSSQLLLLQACREWKTPPSI